MFTQWSFIDDKAASKMNTHNAHATAASKMNTHNAHATAEETIVFASQMSLMLQTLEEFSKDK